MDATNSRVVYFQRLLEDKHAHLVGVVAETLIDDDTDADLVRLSAKASTMEAAVKLFESIFRLNATELDSQVTSGFKVFKEITEQSLQQAEDNMVIDSYTDDQKATITGSKDVYQEIMDELEGLGFAEDPEEPKN